MNSAIRKLAAEFLVIVMGVLVALAVDQWRDDQHERALEAAYASRLVGDLRVDTAEYGALLRGVWVDKRDVLLALSEGQLPGTEDPQEMMVLLDLELSRFRGQVNAWVFNLSPTSLESHASPR